MYVETRLLLVEVAVCGLVGWVCEWVGVAMSE